MSAVNDRFTGPTLWLSAENTEFPPLIDYGRDLRTGLWLPNGEPNRCQGVTTRSTWCANQVLPRSAWVVESNKPGHRVVWMHSLDDVSLMETGLCRFHYQRAGVWG